MTARKPLATLTTAPLAALLASCATGNIGAPPPVADALRPPSSQTLALGANARGVQICRCAQAKDSARVEWAFVAPEAELFDGAGNRIGKHYAGPTWEANDGSKVVAAVKASDAGPDANAIPWLLLVSKSNSGSGSFAHVQSIQRVSTSGGKAPAGSCSPAGQELRVPYTAVYYFYS